MYLIPEKFFRYSKFSERAVKPVHSILKVRQHPLGVTSRNSRFLII